MNTRSIGTHAEDYCADFLKKIGYQILTRNYRTQVGEIDIISKHKDTLVFVEVKYRSSNKFGYPEEAVNFKKQQTIRNVAEYYILTHKNLPQKYRIEVVRVTRRKNKFEAKIIPLV